MHELVQFVDVHPEIFQRQCQAFGADSLATFHSDQPYLQPEIIPPLLSQSKPVAAEPIDNCFGIHVLNEYRARGFQLLLEVCCHQLVLS